MIGYVVFKPEAAIDPNPVDNVVVGTTSEIIASKLAEALTAKGVKFYGAYWCTHCEDQKEMFGSALEKLNYVECAIPGQQGQVKECTDAGVSSYPTWIFPDGSIQTGVMSFEQLAERAGISLDEVTPEVTVIEVVQ